MKVFPEYFKVTEGIVNLKYSGNFFKLWTMKVFPEYFKFTIPSVTFDILLGHKVNENLKWVISKSQELLI